MMPRRSHSLGALPLVILLAVVACSTGGGPTGPSSPGTSSLSGQVVDQFSGAGVAGAAVQFAGASTVTDAGGHFSISGASGSAGPVVVVGAGYHDRQTFAAGSAVRIAVVPASFNMTTFHDVGRENSQRTIRWLASPTLYLDTRVQGGAVDPAELQQWIAEIQAIAPSVVVDWSGSALAGRAVAVGEAPPASGAIVLQFDENPASYPTERTAGLTTVTWGTNGVISAVRIRLRLSELTGPTGALARRAILAHELGHAMGLGHVEGETMSLMSPVVRTTTLTEFDRAVARIHYGRAPGNTSLDRDQQAMPATGALAPAVSSVSRDWGCQLELDS